MLAALHVAKNGDPQLVLGSTVNIAMQTGRVGIEQLRVEQEDVGLCAIGNIVHMLEHIFSDRSAIRIHNHVW